MSRPRPINLIVLIDALGWRYLENQSFLQNWLPYRRPLRTVLGFSSGAIPTILTGLPPATTGHWNLFYYDPRNSPFQWMKYFQFLPQWVTDHRVTRRLVTEIGRRFLGMGTGFECCVSPRLLPWFNWVEKKNIYDRGGISGAPSIFDRLAGEGISFRAYSYHDSSDAEIFQRVEFDLENSDATFFFIYLCEMDMLLHLHCHEPAAIKEKLDWYERNLQTLFERARYLDPEATLTLISDHGMTPVEHHYDLVQEIESLGFRMPRHYLALYDSTMARFWFFDDRARRAITERLTTLSCGRILGPGELQQLGVYFPDSRYGEIVFLLHPGWLLSHSDFNGHGWSPVGMHGYHPDDPYSDAIFLSNDEPSVTVRTISDVFQCMEEATIGR